MVGVTSALTRERSLFHSQEVESAKEGWTEALSEDSASRMSAFGSLEQNRCSVGS